MNEDESHAFRLSVLSMSEDWRQKAKYSPNVSRLLFDLGDIETLSPPHLDWLRSALVQDLTIKFTMLASDYPEQALIGSSIKVQLSRESLSTFRPGCVLDAAAVRAALLSNEWSFPSNVMVIDPVRFGQGLLDLVPASVEIIVFPVQARTGQWLLVVFKILAGSETLGLKNVPQADLLLYDSKGEPHHPEDSIGLDVIAYMKRAKQDPNFSFVLTEIKVTPTNLIDSGVAAVENALAIIYGRPFEQNLSEVACWEKREKYLRQCVESAKANAPSARKSPQSKETHDIGELSEDRGTFVSSPDDQTRTNRKDSSPRNLRRTSAKEKTKLESPKEEKPNTFSSTGQLNRRNDAGPITPTRQARQPSVVTISDDEGDHVAEPNSVRNLQQPGLHQGRRHNSQGQRRHQSNVVSGQVEEDESKSFSAFMGQQPRAKHDTSGRASIGPRTNTKNSKDEDNTLDAFLGRKKSRK